MASFAANSSLFSPNSLLNPAKSFVSSSPLRCYCISFNNYTKPTNLAGATAYPLSSPSLQSHKGLGLWVEKGGKKESFSQISAVRHLTGSLTSAEGLRFAIFHQYQVVGRVLPTETEEHPKIFRMKLWATNEVRAKSKFWITETMASEGDPRCAHAQAIKQCITPTPQNMAFFNNLITVYSKSNLHSSALHLFHSIPCPNTVTWTSIISASANSPFAFLLFLSMLRHPRRPRPNAHTFATLLRTCASLSDHFFGLQLLSLSFKLSLHKNPYVGSAFVSLYSKTRDLPAAVKLFEEMPDRDEVCYSAVVNGLAQNQRPIDALRYFVGMKREGVVSTFHSVSGALSAASKAAMLEQCMIIHGHAVVTGLDCEIYVATALIDGYGKCGVVDEARIVFEGMGTEVNIVGWNAMMAAYAQQGSWGDVVRLFGLMESRGIEADKYSFLAVLTSFYNVGMVEETELWLGKMKKQYKLEALIEHYTCLIGVMGKAGRLGEAMRVALTMPYEPDAAVWRVLLSSCGNITDPGVAWRISERMLEMDPNDDSAYVILANAFASAGRWDEVRKVWKKMRGNGVRKEAGSSWIEVRGRIHVFFAGRDEIRGELGELMSDIERVGFALNEEWKERVWYIA